jgi:hypothetical protein
MNDLVRTLRALDQRLEQTNAGEVPGNLTAGSVVFVSSTKSFTQNNANLFWDNTNKRLGIGTASPAYELDLVGSVRISANLYCSAYRASSFDMSNTGAGASTLIEIGATATGNRYAILDFHGDDTYTDYGLRLYRSNGGSNTHSVLTHRGTGPLYIYAEDAASIEFVTSALLRWYIEPSGNLNPAGAGSLNIGSASEYVGTINCKEVVDRGCISRSSRWEMPDGRFVSGLEAICAMRAHPTEQTIYGMTKLDYGSVPRVSQKPAPIADKDVYEDVVIAEADPKRGKDRVTEKRLKWRMGEKMGADGVEMTSLFSQMLDAFVEIDERLRRLEK